MSPSNRRPHHRDRELAKRLLGGDERSYRELFDHQVPRLYSNARGLEIEDVKYTEPVDGRFRTVFAEELWLGLLPSFGISWEF